MHEAELRPWPEDDATPTVVGDRPTESGAAEEQVLRPGDPVARYVVLDHLGQGGMGVVYAAYDPRLDRKIALKLLRTRSEVRDRGLEARLLREAQALAKLNDPHVLTVYDVGTFADRVFLAVEHVEGQDLARWLKAKPRGRSEILDVFVQAGRGLAAAHGRGLVHRDFKPSNVMVRADDGRALVLDFGLARSTGAEDGAKSGAEDGAKSAAGAGAESGEQASEDGATTGGEPASELTMAGTIVGTPAFMAPEQWDGLTPTAAGDQFSFCVALYQALYGQFPFATTEGGRPAQWTVTPAPDGRDVPARLRRILLRGLSRRPEDRFPSMDALLRELSHDTRRRWSLAAGVALLGLLWAVWPAGRGELCAGADERIAAVWNAPRRDALQRAFDGTGRPYAASSARGVAQMLDRFAEGWRLMYVDACEGTHVRGDQSAQLLDRRMACLEQRRRELGSLVDLFINQPEQTVEGASRAVGALTPLADCADTAALMSPMAMPTDEESRRRVDALHGRMAENRALLIAGRYEDALAPAHELVDAARASGYLPVLAEAWMHLGRVQEAQALGADAAASLEKAVAVAQAADHDRVAAEAFVRRVRVVGHLLGDHDGGDFFTMLAESSLDRLDRGDDLRATLADHKGLLEVEKGNPEAAVGRHLAALELKKNLHGPEHPTVARSLVRLGTVLHDLGRFQEAHDRLQEALHIQQVHLGEQHPEVAATLDRLGNVAYRLGRLESAQGYYEQALDILERAFGPDHTRVATTMLHTASVLSGLGRHHEALALFDRSLQTLIQHQGPTHPSVAAVWSNIGATHIEMRDFQGALKAYEHAVELQEETLGPEHPALATTYFNLGEVWNELQQPDRAERRHRQALKLWRKALGDEHYLIGHGLTGLGRAFLESGRPREAVAHFEQALALWRDQEQDPAQPAWTRWLLAQALTESDPERALGSARLALKGFRASAGHDPHTVADIERWLEARAQGSP